MIRSLFPRDYRRYLSLPLLGAIADDFARWLIERGYTRLSARFDVRALTQIDQHLRRRGHRTVPDLTHESLRACSAALSRKNYVRGCIVRVLSRFLEASNLVPPPDSPTPTPIDTRVAEYSEFLEDARGFRASTVQQHRCTATLFLTHLSFDGDPARLRAITASDIESFVRARATTCNRHSLQHVVAQLRGFLRFLVTSGAAPAGLDSQIDTPRVYRLERLPRSLPWSTVCALLSSIDRSTPLGDRDYTIFFLMATYGLRASEIVSLTLDDIDWRGGSIRVCQRKAGTSMFLPLTDEAGSILYRYLRRGRPSLPYREVFLRARAPHGVLKPTAVGDAFHAWVRRSGLDIPIQGAHCLRHSYAVHLLRQGTSLKTIGDLLGHRTAESTCVYLRLATDDLRDVALSLPRSCVAKEDQP